MNKTIMKELGLKTLLFKSKPITLKDVETQLKGLELAMPVATRESFLKEMNTVATMNLEMAEVPAQGVGPDNMPLKNTPTADEMDSGKLPASMRSETGDEARAATRTGTRGNARVLKPGDEMHPKPKKGQKIMARPEGEEGSV